MTKTRWLMLIPLALLALAGCEGEQPKPKVKSREIIRKTTQNVYNLDEELKKGAVLADTKIPVSDPLTQASKGYVFATSQLAIDAVTMRLGTYEALNGSYPKTHEEFMENIIKSPQDPMQLPMLPFYMEYAYDVPNHRLVILKYPEREKQFDEQQDKKLGRK
jgi:hypothetical protein